MAIKVTSLASSSSGAPTPPPQTPSTEAADHMDMEPATDLGAVGNILEPIEEDLNEAAENAAYPSPPTNTPFFSPVSSVRNENLASGRARGLSLIGDRLSQLKIEGRVGSTKDDDSSTQSMVPNIGEEGEDDYFSDGKANPDMVDSVTSDGLMAPVDSGEIQIAPGSPGINPRIEEYLAFDPKDEDNDLQRPVSASHSMQSEVLSFKSATGDRQSITSEGGVVELSKWAEELIEQVKRDLARLEQLAEDEHTGDSCITAEGYYRAILQDLLSDSTRKYPLEIIKKEK